MKLKPFCALVCLVVLQLATAAAADYESLKADAEKLIAEGSYARAHEVYQQVKANGLSAAEVRWVQFRLADTQWRSQYATETADTTKIDAAREQLERLVRDVKLDEEKDRVWVEAQESLGDFWWTRRNNNNWGQALPHYQQALDWWGGARDIELARKRYLDIVWRMARPPGVARHYYYGYWGNTISIDILENALKIAQTDNDKAHAHYLIAMSLRHQGGWEQRQRVPDEFEAAVKSGKGTDWYDDALYHYAEWMAGQGRAIPLEDGGWTQKPDYVKALEMFRKLTSEFQKGETRYYDQAKNQIENITRPTVNVSVAHLFLPDSEIQYHLGWRNVKRVDLALYPVDLTRDVQLSKETHRRHNWLESIDLATREKLKSWTKETGDKGEHEPGSEQLRLDEKLPPGAYVLEARSGDTRARELILVTDAALILKTSGKQALVYFCNTMNGAPLSGGKVRLWERWHDGKDWQWRDLEKETDKDGLCVFDLKVSVNNEELFVAAMVNDRQAFAAGYSYYGGRRGDEGTWKIYAFTDRPAYRPKETVNWKFVARRYNGSVYSTPSNQTIEYQITDARGTKVSEGQAALNTFGSAWGTLELTEAMPLGEFRVTFWEDKARQHQIGHATLFRLEEYKLPEFKVSVETPAENGKKKSFRLGEQVEVAIQADYYFGGAVANATVEVLVHQNPFYHTWRRPRDFPWFYEDMDNSQSRWRRSYGGGQIVKRETLKTDATGKATLRFDTPANANQDFEYRIEARVTDASRREIVGNGTVRVTRQRYYVYAHAEHNLYRPQDKVTVEFKAIDANEHPVQAEGIVKVTRDYWYEIWIDPDGKEVKGDELKALQAQHRIWPPLPPRPDRPGWRLKFRGYEHDEILTRALKTDTNGMAELSFTPEREGYYRIAWTSEDAVKPGQRPARITAETTVWVATGKTTELGYRHGGMEIIVDKDTFRVGQKAPVMLVVPTNDRYVLFSVEGEDLYSYQLIHLDGTVKLVELDVEEKHVPNIFLSAALVHDRQFFLDTKQVVVPPTKNFLTVDVQPDREQYQPREAGTLTVTTKDHEGKPVSAEVALSLVDESVFYIQSDYAGDPRQFYFGTKRPQRIQTQSTFNQKSYARLVEGEDDKLIEERELLRRRASGLGEDWFYDDSAKKEFADKLPRSESAYYARPEAQATTLGVARKMAVGGVAPESPVPLLAGAAVALDAVESKSLAFPQQQAGEEPAVTVRSDFRSTILWQPDVVTGADGKATVKVKYPDSLTGWKVTARAATAGNQFGIDDATTRTKQPLIVRLQAPRFFVVGDTVTVSAVVNNNTDEASNVEVTLEVVVEPEKRGGNPVITRPLRLAQGSPAKTRVNVSANGEARVDWVLSVQDVAATRLKVTARGSKHSDAMERDYPIFQHGIEKFITKAGKVRGNDITVKLDLPKERKTDSTKLTVQVTPSMAVTMLDALPYLIDYPYGCTEQTMSRFLPSVITAKTLRDVGLDPEDVMGRVFGGIEQAHVSATQPKGKQNLAKLDEMMKAGLDRLYDFQHSDGGWGWWKEGESDHWMTAYVVWGLSLARDAEVKVKEDVLNGAKDYLAKEIVEEEENPDMQAWMLHALAAYYAPYKDQLMSLSVPKAFDNLWTNRDKLNAYTRALLALSAHHFGKADEAKVLIRNLENGVKRDDRPDTSVLINGKPDNSAVMGTAHWGEDGIYWRWSEGGVEATAFALRALLAIDPQNKLVEPVTNWLIKNRRGAQWSNTRDTAIVVLTMNDYLRVSGELKPEMEYELIVNGKSIAKKKLSGNDVFNAPSRFEIDPGLIRDGANEIRIKRKGEGPVYFAAEAVYFSLEEPIPAAGSEIFVKREYFKLVGRPTLLKGYVYDKVPLRDGESVKSGERVETLITIEAKNNYEYLVFEDLKPAGFEAVEIRSGESLYARELKSGAVQRKFELNKSAGTKHVVKPGETLSKIANDYGVAVAEILKFNRGINPGRLSIGVAVIIPPKPGPGPPGESDFTGRTRWVYQELRDRKVALFLDKLPEGVWEIRYDFRAEAPGTFHALPVLGHAMYVPEIRCNGAEVRVKVEDAQ